MLRVCCDDQEWHGVADLGHTAGFDFDLRRCAKCGADLLSIAYADWPTVHVISRAQAKTLLGLGDGERKRALRRWADED